MLGYNFYMKHQSQSCTDEVLCPMEKCSVYTYRSASLNSYEIDTLKYNYKACRFTNKHTCL